MGQTEPNSQFFFRRFLQIFAFPGNYVLAFRRRRFSQKTAGNRRFSQKTAGETADFCRNFVPFSVSLLVPPYYSGTKI